MKAYNPLAPKAQNRTVYATPDDRDQRTQAGWLTEGEFWRGLYERASQNGNAAVAEFAALVCEQMGIDVAQLRRGRAA